MSRRHGASRRWWVPAVLLALALASASIAVAAHQVGYWLVVEDPLRRAATVVVLGGDFPFRAVEAADRLASAGEPQLAAHARRVARIVAAQVISDAGAHWRGTNLLRII